MNDDTKFKLKVAAFLLVFFLWPIPLLIISEICNDPATSPVESPKEQQSGPDYDGLRDSYDDYGQPDPYIHYYDPKSKEWGPDMDWDGDYDEGDRWVQYDEAYDQRYNDIP